MAKFIAKRVMDSKGVLFRVIDDQGKPLPSCEDFLIHLRMRDCSIYTERMYSIGLAHFFTWLDDVGVNSNDITRQVIGRYVAHFSQSKKEGAVASQSGDKVRSPRTINHCLSVLASYFDFHIHRDTEDGDGLWCNRHNPISGKLLNQEFRHGMAYGDRPPRTRQRGGFRRRVSREIPERLEVADIEKLVDAAFSFRDKAILPLLCRTGRRIGDWSSTGCQGILGMSLSDLDRKRQMIVVRLKGARDEHRVPVTDDFWPVLERYLTEERSSSLETPALWVAARKGRGMPLTYATFESALRYISRKTGVAVHAHLFRHTLAQGALDLTGNLKVAQEFLGHAHISTTGDQYMRVDTLALVETTATVKSNWDRKEEARSRLAQTRYAFPYDADTISELEQAIARPALPDLSRKTKGTK